MHYGTSVFISTTPQDGGWTGITDTPVRLIVYNSHNDIAFSDTNQISVSWCVIYFISRLFNRLIKLQFCTFPAMKLSECWRLYETRLQQLTVSLGMSGVFFPSGHGGLQASFYVWGGVEFTDEWFMTTGIVGGAKDVTVISALQAFLGSLECEEV